MSQGMWLDPRRWKKGKETVFSGAPERSVALPTPRFTAVRPVKDFDLQNYNVCAVLND